MQELEIERSKLEKLIILEADYMEILNQSQQVDELIIKQYLMG